MLDLDLAFDLVRVLYLTLFGHTSYLKIDISFIQCFICFNVFWIHVSETSAGILRGGPLRNFLGFKENLDWLEIDLNRTKIITVHDYQYTKN